MDRRKRRRFDPEVVAEVAPRTSALAKVEGRLAQSRRSTVGAEVVDRSRRVVDGSLVADRVRLRAGRGTQEVDRRLAVDRDSGTRWGRSFGAIAGPGLVVALARRSHQLFMARIGTASSAAVPSSCASNTCRSCRRCRRRWICDGPALISRRPEAWSRYLLPAAAPARRRARALHEVLREQRVDDVDRRARGDADAVLAVHRAVGGDLRVGAVAVDLEVDAHGAADDLVLAEDALARDAARGQRQRVAGRAVEQDAGGVVLVDARLVDPDHARRRRQRHDVVGRAPER